MPQGKGTYGSKVGRPPKKKKYKTGGSVDPFSSKNPEGVVTEKAMEEIEEMNAIPTANAMDRSQASPMGNEVGTGMYAVGGYVPKAKKKKAKLTGKIGQKSKEQLKSIAEREYEKRGEKREKKERGETDPMKLLDRRLAKTPPKKGKGLAAPKSKNPKKNKKGSLGSKSKWEGRA